MIFCSYIVFVQVIVLVFIHDAIIKRLKFCCNNQFASNLWLFHVLWWAKLAFLPNHHLYNLIDCIWNTSNCFTERRVISLCPLREIRALSLFTVLQQYAPMLYVTNYQRSRCDGKPYFLILVIVHYSLHIHYSHL